MFSFDATSQYEMTMHLGWLLDRYPEIAHLPQREQEVLIEAARRRVLRGVRHWASSSSPSSSSRSVC